VLDVRRWAEIRRMREVEGLSIHEIVRRTRHDRNTVRRALRREGQPRYHYHRPARPSKLDAFKDEIHRLLRDSAVRLAASTSAGDASAQAHPWPPGRAPRGSASRP
jgi:hypothetical protein